MISLETTLVDQQKNFLQLRPRNMKYSYLIFLKQIWNKFSLYYSKQKHMQLKLCI